MWITPRLHMLEPFPRLSLLRAGHGVKSLFPRLGLLLGWYDKEE